MKNFYVVGNNTSKSLSPTIFNYWFKKYKIKARYNYLQLNNNNFDLKITNLLRNKKTHGLNITVPFKQKIMKHINLIDKDSVKINAVNCVITRPKTKGINTDWTGYYKTLPKTKNLKSKKTLIIGYGGAALAIHYVLNKKGFKNIIVFNRTKKKLSFVKKTKYTKSINQLKLHLGSADIIINTTPKNLIKKQHKKLIKEKTILSDIVYSPKETPFLRDFPTNKKIYGISMLLQQAVPCFKAWFGFKPAIDQELIQILNRKIK